MKKYNGRMLSASLDKQEWEKLIKWIADKGCSTLPMIFSNESFRPDIGVITVHDIFIDWSIQVYYRKDAPKEARREEKWLAKFLGITATELNRHRGFYFCTSDELDCDKLDVCRRLQRKLQDSPLHP